ncbi:MAG: sulfotransferase [Pseudomonadota bacterium]
MRVEREDFPALGAARRLWSAGKTGAAIGAFDAAVKERPRNVKAPLEAARAFGARFEIARAERLLEAAERLAGDDPDVAPQIAISFGRIFREHRAIARLKALPGRAPVVRAELAALYEKAGRLEDAHDEINACIAAAPDAAEPRLVRARILRRSGAQDEALGSLQALTARELAPTLRAEAWTEICYLRDRDGDPAAAVAAIDHAHDILRALPQTPQLLARARANNRMIEALSAGFTAGMLADWRRRPRAAAPSVGEIGNLVGFPRSGTTLLEQCLDGHPGLVASPERAVFTQATLPQLCQAGGGGLSLATLDRVSASAQARAQAHYLGFMEAALGQPVGGRLHLDKNPNHTGLLPGLLRLFPQARTVFALRDPRDVVTSCVLRSFRLTEFSAMLLDWGTATELYAAEMGAWLRYREAIAPEAWVETRYEDMIADPMAETQRVLTALGLEWHPDVARYRDRLAGKVVNSPTQTEVRQPVYRHAVGRWRAYRRHLDAHMHRLAPFISAFGYD